MRSNSSSSTQVSSGQEFRKCGHNPCRALRQLIRFGLVKRSIIRLGRFIYVPATRQRRSCDPACESPGGETKPRRVHCCVSRQHAQTLWSLPRCLHAWKRRLWCRLIVPWTINSSAMSRSKSPLALCLTLPCDKGSSTRPASLHGWIIRTSCPFLTWAKPKTDERQDFEIACWNVAELTDNVKYWVGRSGFYLTLSSESDSQAKALRLAYNCGFLGHIPKISALLLESFADWHVPRNQSGVFTKSPHFLLESFAGGNRLMPHVSVLMGTRGNGVRTHNAAQLLFASTTPCVSLLQAWPQLIGSGSSIV